MSLLPCSRFKLCKEVVDGCRPARIFAGAEAVATFATLGMPWAIASLGGGWYGSFKVAKCFVISLRRRIDGATKLTSPLRII